MPPGRVATNAETRYSRSGSASAKHGLVLVIGKPQSRLRIARAGRVWVRASRPRINVTRADFVRKIRAQNMVPVDIAEQRHCMCKVLLKGTRGERRSSRVIPLLVPTPPDLVLRGNILVDSSLVVILIRRSYR